MPKQVMASLWKNRFMTGKKRKVKRVKHVRRKHQTTNAKQSLSAHK